MKTWKNIEKPFEKLKQSNTLNFSPKKKLQDNWNVSSKTFIFHRNFQNHEKTNQDLFGEICKRCNVFEMSQHLLMFSTFLNFAQHYWKHLQKSPNKLNKPKSWKTSSTETSSKTVGNNTSQILETVNLWARCHSRSSTCKFQFHLACFLKSSVLMRPWRCDSSLESHLDLPDPFIVSSSFDSTIIQQCSCCVHSQQPLDMNDSVCIQRLDGRLDCFFSVSTFINRQRPFSSASWHHTRPDPRLVITNVGLGKHLFVFETFEFGRQFQKYVRAIFDNLEKWNLENKFKMLKFSKKPKNHEKQTGKTKSQCREMQKMFKKMFKCFNVFFEKKRICKKIKILWRSSKFSRSKNLDIFPILIKKSLGRVGFS